MTSKLLTVGLAARRVGLGPERIRQLCDLGQLDHIRDASGRRLISTEAVEDLARRRKDQTRVGARG